jgi:hypothetical protein
MQINIYKNLLFIFSLFLSFAIFSQTTSFETTLIYGSNTRLQSVCKTKVGSFIAIGNRTNAYTWGNTCMGLVIVNILENGEIVANSIKVLKDDSLSYRGVSIIDTKDGNCLILLSITAGLFDCNEHTSLLKIDPSKLGTDEWMLWSKCFNNYNFVPLSISEDENSNLKIEGMPKNDCLFIYKTCNILTDANGNEISNNIDINPPKDNYVNLGDFKINNDSKISFRCSYSEEKLLIESILNNSDKAWEKGFTDIGYYTSVVHTDTNSVLLLTRDCRISTKYGLRLMNIDFFGNIKFDTTYFTFNSPIPSKLLRTNDGNYVFYTSVQNGSRSEIKLVKVSITGKIIWTSTVFNSKSDVSGTELKVLEDGYILLADVIGNTPYGDRYPIFYRFDSVGSISPMNKWVYNFNTTMPAKSVYDKANSLKIFPNPVRDRLFVYSHQNTENYYEIFSSDGKLLLKGTIINNSSIGVSDLNSGIYFIKVSKNNTYLVQKFVKVE